MVNNKKPLITEGERQELMKKEGKVRGLSLLEDKQYILRKKGEKGLEKIQRIIKRSGSDFNFKKLRRMEMYPLGIQALILEAVKRGFNYQEEDFKEMGVKEAKASPLVRLFMKYFVSLERMVPTVSRMWRMYFTKGDLRVVSIDKQKGEFVMKIKDWQLSPYNCQILTGYLPTLLKMVVNTPVTCQETKCVFKGDEHHEFLLKWKH